uniref:Carotenoid cleavage dioxygenase 4 isoform 3 n=1 Tax=Bixa orellana TaxID=66672 RepID=A0A9Y0ZEY5_BIXOR|nr:carotenoid cleavage dioxygenase 4 isoform 3 [Bixa orellana]
MYCYSISSPAGATIAYHEKTSIYTKETREGMPKIPSFGILPLIKTQQASHLRKLRMTIVKKQSTKTSSPLSPSFLSALASKASHFIHSSISNVISPPIQPWVDPDQVLTGNFAPVEEMGPTECPVVEGQLPPSLNGTAYLRNGSNPQLRPRRALQYFEADGMIHSLHFSSDGRAIYSSRYVETYKYKIERKNGAATIPNFMAGFYGLIDVARFFGLLGQILRGRLSVMEGFGGANTSVAFFGKKLMALCESDLPYIITLTEDGDIKTLKRWDFDRRVMANMTAHPKFDEDTKEAFAFRYNMFCPFLTFFRFDENGVKHEDVNITSLKQPCLIHDFAITKRFVVFDETQLVFSVAKMMLGRGSIVDHNPKKIPRIGVLPRYATNDSDLKWFYVPGFNGFHLVNAWENEEDEIEILGTNVLSLGNILVKRVTTSLDKVTINMQTGEISRKVLSPRNLEFGAINSSYAGKRNRYAYFAVMEEVPKTSGVVKIDLETGREVGIRFYGVGSFGGEPLFVRKDAENGASPVDEDDGYVISYVHNENTEESRFLVMDAKSPELEIVAAIKMPRRVPYGFHGLFLSKEELSNIRVHTP